MDLDDRGLTPHAHIPERRGVQCEQPRFARQHWLLPFRQPQSLHGLVRLRLLAGLDENLGDVRSERIRRIRPVLLWVGQRDGRLVAQMLDVERLARSQVDDALGQLGGAGFHVRAANVLVSLLGRCELRSAGRATIRHDEFAQVVFTPLAAFHDRPDQFGNHVAGLAHHHRIADQHPLALDLERIVQCRARHRGPRYIHGLEHGDGRDAPGTPDLHGDVQQFGVDLLGRVLVGDGPTRRPRGRAQRPLQAEIVDLDDDAVERVLDVAAVLAVIVDHVEDLRERRDLTVVRRHRHSPLGVQRVRLGLVGDDVMRAGGPPRAPAQRTDAMRVKAQPPCGGDARILLPERSGRRIARVGERRAPGILLFTVERLEIVPTHEHLAADLHELGDIRGRPAEIGGNGADRAHIERDVLTGDAVATRQPLFQHAVAVYQIQCQAVYLHLAGHRQRLALRPVQIAQHRIVPIAQLLDREHVVKAHHARRMPHRSEIIGERAADPVRGRLR